MDGITPPRFRFHPPVLPLVCSGGNLRTDPVGVECGEWYQSRLTTDAEQFFIRSRMKIIVLHAWFGSRCVVCFQPVFLIEECTIVTCGVPVLFSCKFSRPWPSFKTGCSESCVRNSSADTYPKPRTDFGRGAMLETNPNMTSYQAAVKAKHLLHNFYQQHQVEVNRTSLT